MRIRWVKVWVDAMATLTERFRDDEGRVDFEALGREEYAFRHALVTGDFSRSERARDLYDNTINEITSRSEAGRKGAEARWSKNTAAATTREGVDDLPDRESGYYFERANGCNPLTADAPHREAGGNVTDGSNSGKLESGTSANHYDQENQISTNSPAGAGVNLDSHHTNKSPDASSGNAEGVDINGSPITINGSRAACTSTTSGQTIDTTDALDKPGAGEVPPENVSKKPSPALPVPSKRPHGEFGNVLLTDDEFAKLQEKTTNAWDLITELDQYIESQGKTKKYKSHYATLLNWSRRKAQEAKPVQGRRFETAADRDREEIQKIADYYAAQERGEKPPMPKIQLVEGL